MTDNHFAAVETSIQLSKNMSLEPDLAVISSCISQQL